jgi:hypothetical protein
MPLERSILSSIKCPKDNSLILPLYVFCFISELLQDLENCENDPVAIAECFVSKVSRKIHLFRANQGRQRVQFIFILKLE